MKKNAAAMASAAVQPKRAKRKRPFPTAEAIAKVGNPFKEAVKFPTIYEQLGHQPDTSKWPPELFPLRGSLEKLETALDLWPRLQRLAWQHPKATGKPWLDYDHLNTEKRYLHERYSKLLERHGGNFIVFFSDLHNGTPYAWRELLKGKVTLEHIRNSAFINKKYPLLEGLLQGPMKAAYQTTPNPETFLDDLRLALKVDPTEEKWMPMGAVIDGVVVDSYALKQIAKVTSRDHLRSELVNALLSPAHQTIRVLSSPQNNLVKVMSHVRKIKEDGSSGPAPANPTNPAAAEAAS